MLLRGLPGRPVGGALRLHRVRSRATSIHGVITGRASAQLFEERSARLDDDKSARRGDSRTVDVDHYIGATGTTNTSENDQPHATIDRRGSQLKAATLVSSSKFSLCVYARRSLGRWAGLNLSTTSNA